MANVNKIKVADGSYADIEDTTARTGISNIAGSLSAEYSNNKTYAIGSFCEHDDVLYKCTAAITTAEDWNAAHWTAATLTEIITAAITATNTSLSTKVNTADIVNNLTATVSGSPLDATQGKALSDSIATLNSNLVKTYSITVNTTENSYVNPFTCYGSVYLPSEITRERVVGVIVYTKNSHNALAYCDSSSNIINVVSNYAETFTIKVMYI